jgi:hypothetical protein
VLGLSPLDLQVALTLFGRVIISILLDPLLILTELLVTLLFDHISLLREPLVGVLKLFKLLAQVSFLTNAITVEKLKLFL